MKGIRVCNDCTDISSLKGGENMNFKNLSIIGVVLLVGVFGYFLIAGTTSQTTNQTQIVQSQQQEVKTTQSDFEKRFVAFTTANLAKASQDDRAVVFFHASWCPLCSEAEADLKANWEKVPKDVTILKTDYDSSKDLKAKYRIVSQDTWVQVDKDGNELTKWNSGGKGLSSLLANLK